MTVRLALIDGTNPDATLLREAAALITAGEVLVCPTDTGYAFSANALDVKAVTKVFELKGRDYANPVHIAVSSLEEAKKYAYIDMVARCLAERFLPGALTLVLPRKETVPAILVAGRDTIGIRVPDNRIILSLAAMTKLPLTTTSANITGKPTPYSIHEIIEQMGETIGNVALILDQGTIYPPELSTIVDLTVSPPHLLRQGRISWEVIQSTLRGETDT